MVVHALGELPPELRMTPEQDERLVAQAKTVAPIDVVRLLELIAAALRAMKDGADARTQLELALVKAAEPAHDPSTKALLARIERLEGRAPGAGAAAARPGRARHRGRPHPRGGRPRPPRPRRDAGAPEPGTEDAHRSRVAEQAVTAVAVVETDGDLLARGVLADVAGGARDARGRVADARRRAARGAPVGARRPGPHARVARVGGVLQAPGRGPGQARADRAVDPRRHGRLAAARLRARRRGRTRPEPISEDELVARFKHEFGAVEERRRRRRSPDAATAQPPEHAPPGAGDDGAAAAGPGGAEERARRGQRRRRHGQGRHDRRPAPRVDQRSTPTRSIPRTSRCCRTWSSRRSTRPCARRRSCRRASSAGSTREGSTR